MERGRQKKEIRQEMKRRLSALSPEEKGRATRALERRLEGLACYFYARRVMCYVGVGFEIDTTPLLTRALAAGKEVFVPRCLVAEGRLLVSALHDLGELDRGYFGLLEPKPEYIRPFDPAKLDVIIVPGLAFDLNGYRVGQGGGYYDRLLAEIGPQTVLLALAFDFQVYKQLPVESHDCPVHRIITPSRTINCRSLPPGWI